MPVARRLIPLYHQKGSTSNELHVAAELRGIRKSAAASRRWEVAAQTATGIRQTRVRSKLRGIDILNRVKLALFCNKSGNCW